ncbi:MAG TPA: hypothetical protein VEK06_04210, partial [Myxococcota bacterium]|nr:hypothetical protein [Myxococcota bacterium]
MTINPLMHEASLKAQVMRGNKVVREYVGKKIIQTVLNDAKNTWTPARAKLALHIPELAVGEYVVMKTTYAWMDPRWHWPFFLESPEPTGVSKISIDVPFGVAMRFKASNNGEAYDLVPSSQNIENLLWGRKSKESGVGSRYVFEHDFGLKASAKNPRARMQLFFSFDLTMQQEKSSLFDNWTAVSSFLYDRIDRYDLPSNAIREFTQKECENRTTELSKVTRVLSYLKNDIEKRAVIGSFLEQDVQTATRTFARRFGSPFDIVILGKAMLTSIGIQADLLAVGSPEDNVQLSDFFTPALFSKVILAITADDQTFYVDPSFGPDRLDTLPIDLQGQNALIIRKDKGQFFALPFLGPEHNESSLNYQLVLNPQGKLEGSFSLDLFGMRAETLRANLLEMKRSLSALELQDLLNFGDTLRWQTAALRDEKESNTINISGYISPRLLRKEEMGHSL